MLMADHDRDVKAEGKIEGLIEGRSEGIALINELTNLLISTNRLDDLKRSTQDSDFQHKLLIEFGLIEE